MSFSPTPSTPSPYADPRRGDVAVRAPVGPPWAMLAVVAAILAASGGVRLWQEGRVGRALQRGRSSPFPLAGLPMTIGSWEGRPTTMDPKIVRISGGTDVVTRHYVDRRTGVGLDVLALYGPTSDMFAHTPEICYPSAGFDALPGVFDRPIVVEGVSGGAKASVPFRSLAFIKGEGGLADSQEVYYSLWYDGHWTTQAASSKAAMRLPGMYRVQVSRRLTGRERRDVDNPCEPFLAALIGEIEARMAGHRPEATASRRAEPG